MNQNFAIYKYRMNIDKVKDFGTLKDELLKQKVIHHKYRYIIEEMSEQQLKNFVYTGEYVKDRFEGVGIIFMYIKNNDLKKIINFITKTSLNPLSILRLIIFTLNNSNRYQGKFLLYLKEFKNVYQGKFKKLLFNLGQKQIDRLDLINLFIQLLVAK